jgi:MFS superfamily sulfate permease-like transporter
MNMGVHMDVTDAHERQVSGDSTSHTKSVTEIVHEHEVDEKAHRPPPWIRLQNHIIDSTKFYVNNPTALKAELVSGITISILKVPESVAFSYVAGVHPLQGLYGSFFMGLTTAIFGGRPGMISGCAGALAVVLTDMMEDSGPFGDKCPKKRREYVYFTMVLTGIFQAICGFFQLAKFVKLIPKTAFLGFFNGLAVVIFMSQLDTFKKPKAGDTANTLTGCEAVDFGFSQEKEWYSLSESTTWLMLLHVAIVMSTMEIMPRLPKIPVPKLGPVAPSRVLPPALVGLLLAMAVEWGIIRPSGSETPIVKDVSRIDGGFPDFHIPDVPWDEWKTWSKCTPTALSLCAIGLIESVLTLQAVDQILDQETSIPMKNQECLAQGLANFLSGFFESIGGDAMIGQSMINVFNGAKGRLSAATDAIFLLMYIVSLGGFIESVPTAGLAGILFIVVIHTFNWPSLAIIVRRALPLYMCFTIVLVTLLSIFFNLAIGIFAGVIWESLCYVWFAGKEVFAVEETSGGKKTYKVGGDIYFANCDDFNNLMNPATDPEEVVLDLANSRLRDYSAIFMLNSLGKRYGMLNKKLTIEMTDVDFRHYCAITDCEHHSGSSVLKKLMPTGATKAIEGNVVCRELGKRRMRSFIDMEAIVDDDHSLWQNEANITKIRASSKTATTSSPPPPDIDSKGVAAVKEERVKEAWAEPRQIS